MVSRSISHAMRVVGECPRRSELIGFVSGQPRNGSVPSPRMSGVPAVSRILPSATSGTSHRECPKILARARWGNRPAASVCKAQTCTFSQF